MTAPVAESMTIAVRAHALTHRDRNGAWQTRWQSRGQIEPSQFALIFDTETTIDAAQQLRAGAYQFREHGQLREEGLFYDPLSLSAQEVLTLRSYARNNDLVLRTVADFIDTVFFGLAYQRNALIIGFNLPFDISRIAIDHDSARRSMRGGFTFKLSDDPRWPRVQVKHLSRTAALIRFAGVEGQRTKRSARKRRRKTPVRRGFFCDVRSLARALTARPHSLGSLADLLQTPHRKSAGDHGETLTDEYLDYLLNDVQVTWECFEVLASRYEGFGLRDTPVTRILSEASIGKACLRQMGITPWREQQSEIPPTLLGTIMSSYYGGRSEVHVRRQVVRVLYCDFLSMYPTVSVLMGLWRFVVAEGMSWTDATDETQSLVDSVTLDSLGDPAVWRQLTVLCQVEPDCDIFPVRANYEENRAGLSIASNYLTCTQPLWYTLADVLAAKLLGGTTPTIHKAVRFAPGEVQQGLEPIEILGNPDYRIDPNADDYYRRLIDMRSEVKRAARGAPDDTSKARLDANQQAMKIVANSSCYGIFVELNVQERAKRAEVTFAGSDGHLRTVPLASIEEEGRYYHPLLATLTTGAARLMLAIAEALAAREGITWAFCDTDSMALACPDGMEDADFVKRAQRVQEWFERLNPYERQQGLFKLEDANFGIGGGGVAGVLEPLYCFAVSAKRYALFNIDAQGRPVLRKASAHGLGHLTAPYEAKDAPVSILEPQVSLHEIGVERWQYDLWYRIVQAALEGHPQQVDFDGLPGFEKRAVSRYAATTPRLARWFKGYNTGRPYREQVRPFGFLDAFLAKSRGQLGTNATAELPRAVAPFDRDPDVAVMQCFDRQTGQLVRPQSLKSYRQALAQYHLHPEAKFLGGDYADSGILERRHIRAVSVEHIGKEANRWEEQFHLGEDPRAQIVYGQSEREQKRIERQIRESIRQKGVRTVARESRLSVGLVSGILTGKNSISERSTKRLARVRVEGPFAPSEGGDSLPS